MFVVYINKCGTNIDIDILQVDINIANPGQSLKEIWERYQKMIWEEDEEYFEKDYNSFEEYLEDTKSGWKFEEYRIYMSDVDSYDGFHIVDNIHTNLDKYFRI